MCARKNLDLHSTFDLESQPISGRLSEQHDVVATRRGERFLNDPHDVEYGALAQLLFLPDDRVVEHAEVVHVELTVDKHAAAAVDHQLSTARQHHRRPRRDYRHTCNERAIVDDVTGKD